LVARLCNIGYVDWKVCAPLYIAKTMTNEYTVLLVCRCTACQCATSVPGGH
jgi:hypothetical protein